MQIIYDNNICLFSIGPQPNDRFTVVGPNNGYELECDFQISWPIHAPQVTHVARDDNWTALWK